MNKSELINHIALKSDISKAAAGRALAGVIEAVMFEHKFQSIRVLPYVKHPSG